MSSLSVSSVCLVVEARSKGYYHKVKSQEEGEDAVLVSAGGSLPFLYCKVMKVVPLTRWKTCFFSLLYILPVNGWWVYSYLRDNIVVPTS